MLATFATSSSGVTTYQTIGIRMFENLGERKLSKWRAYHSKQLSFYTFISPLPVDGGYLQRVFYFSFLISSFSI